MRFIRIHGIFTSLFIAANVLISTSASAALVSYDYSFDTPVFSLPELTSLNSILLAAGPTISGSVSYNTEDTDPGGSTLLARSFGPVPGVNQFTHSGELDDIFDFYATNFWIDFSAPGTIFQWEEFHPNGRNIFSADFHTGAVHGDCNYTAGIVPSSPCGTEEEGSFSQRIDMQNFSLRQVEEVPAPATLALFGIGLAGLGWLRRK